MIRLKLKGNTSLTLVYKLDDRPNKTSLKAIDIESKYIKSAGGSWVYEEQNGKTLWTQVNTIVLKDSSFLRLCSWMIQWMLKIQTRNAMKKVKSILEKK